MISRDSLECREGIREVEKGGILRLAIVVSTTSQFRCFANPAKVSQLIMTEGEGALEKTDTDP